MNLNQITMPCADISQSRDFYLRLGFTLIVDSPHYLRFWCEEGDATFSLHKTDDACKIKKPSTLIYFECNDLDQSYLELQAKGIVFSTPPTDQSWAWREARLFDPSGNQICLYKAGENRVNPPWRVNIKE